MKKGYLCTEFWLSLIACLAGFLMASGAFETGSTWDKAIGLVAASLAAMGYSASRANVKAAGPLDPEPPTAIEIPQNPDEKTP